MFNAAELPGGKTDIYPNIFISVKCPICEKYVRIRMTGNLNFLITCADCGSPVTIYSDKEDNDES